MNKTYVSIDFGACNIKAAKKIANSINVQKIKLNKEQSGGVQIPNIICYRQQVDGSGIYTIVGQNAKEAPDQENVVSMIKPKLALPSWSKVIPVHNKSLTAWDICQDTFELIWSLIVGQSSTIEDYEVVLTVPVTFTERQKQKLLQVTNQVGIPVKNIITEPFAALLSQEEFLEKSNGEVVLTFDFGGSTLDLSLTRIFKENNGELVITELATAGLDYGGSSIDQAIFEMFQNKKYVNEFKSLLQGPKVETHRKDLMNLISFLKEDLYHDDEEATTSIYTIEGDVYEFELTRTDVSNLLTTSGIIDRITELLDRLIEDAGEANYGAIFDKSEITRVMPVGGTSQIKDFLEMLGEYFGEDVFDPSDFDPDDDIYMGVAIGAVRYGEIIDKNEQSVRISTCIPFSIGIENNGIFMPLIRRNESYGFITLFKSLDVFDLKVNGFRIPIYQSVTGDQVPLDQSDAVFMGDIILTKSLYNSHETILYKMQMLMDGLHMSFYRYTNDGINEFIEEQIILTGGLNRA